ncbi:MAG: phosphotransferase family protein [Acidimicrobiales bacterium]
MPISARDDGDLTRGLEAWMTELAGGGRPRVLSLRRPSAGWSNETVLVTVAWPDRTDDVVVRLPTPVPSFPDYDLVAQAVVQEALADAGIPAPRVIVVEGDPRWLGDPFLVMRFSAGRAMLETPALDPWVMGASADRQRSIQDAFVTLLAAVHRLDWRGARLGSRLRGADGDLEAEVRWWLDYMDWSAGGDPAPTLRRLGEWCLSNAPIHDSTDAALCWGDARLGNLLYDRDGRVAAALDWELASIGPPEMDLGWYLALDELGTRVVRQTVPGFLSREAVIAGYEAQLGRPVAHLGWHEIFALVRSAAINDRQARMATELGVLYPGVAGEENPVLRYISRRIDRLEEAK